jgi:hypothetical protein
VNVEVVRRLVALRVRAGWRMILVLGLLTGLAGGAAVAAVAGAQRTDTAVDRLVAESHTWDLDVLLPDAPPGLAERVAHLDGVQEARISNGSVGAVLDAPRLTFVPVYASADESPVCRGVLLRGRRPDPNSTDQVVLSEGMAKAFGWDVGSTIKWHALSQDQYLQFATAPFTTYDGPRVDLHVVGVTREPSDLLVQSHATMRAGPGFLGAYRNQLQHNDLVSIRVRKGVAPDQLAGKINTIAERANPTSAGDPFPAADVTVLQTARPQVDETITILVRGYWIVALVTALAAIAIISIAIARYLRDTTTDRDTLRALGLSPHSQIVPVVLPVAISAILAAFLSVGLAFALSGLSPIGLARRAEPHRGLAMNVAIVAVGAALVAGAMIGIAVVSAARALLAPRRARPTRTSPAVIEVGKLAQRPSTLFGVRLALEPGGARSAIAVTTIGIAAIIAALTFGAEVHELVATPSAWGYPASQTLELPDAVRQSTLDRLAAAPQVASLASFRSADARFGTRLVPSYSFDSIKGGLGFTMRKGAPPANANEVVLASDTMRALDTHVGGLVTVRTRAGEPRSFRVTGEGYSIGYQGEGYSRGAVFTQQGLLDVAIGEPITSALVGYRAGVDPARAARQLYGKLEYAGPTRPPQIAGLNDERALPYLVVALLAVLTLVALGTAVVSIGRRRRRETATLRALGMTGNQTVWIFVVMALTTAAIAVVLGIPLGLAAGSVLWNRIVEGIGLIPTTTIPWALAALTIPATFVVALTPAVISSARGKRINPAAVLHDE